MFHIEENASNILKNQFLVIHLDMVSITNLILFSKNIIKKSAREKKIQIYIPASCRALRMLAFL
jgi:hypothetical protein